MGSTDTDKRSRRAQQTSDQIIDAAEKLFQQKGFTATSMSEVAEMADVTKSLIHHHFGSKEKLWDAVCGKNQARMKVYLEGLFDNSGDQSDLEFLKTAFTSYFHHIENNPGFSRLQTWVAAEQRSQRSMQLSSLTMLEEKILNAQETGLLRKDISARNIIFLYWSMCEHWHSNRSIYAKRFGMTMQDQSSQEYLDAALSVFLQGILLNPEIKN